MARQSKPDFFKAETQATLDAIKRRSLQTLEKVKTAADPTPWIQERPLTSILAAAGGGLVAGYLLTPPRRAPAAPASNHSDAHRHHSFAEHLETEAFRAIRPALRTFAASAAGSLIATLMPPHAEHQTHHESEDIPRPESRL